MSEEKWSDRDPLLQPPPPQQQPPPYAYGANPPNTGAAYSQAPHPQAMPQQQHATTVVVASPTQYIAPVNLRDQPVRMRCPNCNNEVNTVLDFTAGTLTWLVVIVLLLLGFWICILIPLLMDDMKDVNHTCPVCKYHIGSYKRM